MNKPINVTKTIVCLTTWTNESTGEKIQYESDKQWFYYFNENGNLVLDFDKDQCKEYLQLCDEAVSNNCHSIPVANIHNTSFLSMVLTQFLHVPKTTPAHDVEENI